MIRNWTSKAMGGAFLPILSRMWLKWKPKCVNRCTGRVNFTLLWPCTRREILLLACLSNVQGDLLNSQSTGICCKLFTFLDIHICTNTCMQVLVRTLRGVTRGERNRSSWVNFNFFIVTHSFILWKIEMKIDVSLLEIIICMHISPQPLIQVHQELIYNTLKTKQKEKGKMVCLLFYHILWQHICTVQDRLQSFILSLLIGMRDPLTIHLWLIRIHLLNHQKVQGKCRA